MPLKLRFYIDPETGQPHIHRHGVTEGEAEDVVRNPGEDRPGSEGSRVAIGQTQAGRYLRVIYVSDPELGQRVRYYGVRVERKTVACLQKEAKEEIMKQGRFPKGWDKERVKRVIEHYEQQTEEEAMAEDEAAHEDPSQTFMEVPRKLVPEVRELIAKREG